MFFGKFSVLFYFMEMNSISRTHELKQKQLICIVINRSWDEKLV